MKSFARVVFTIAALAAPAAASAQEVRCPAGYDTIPTPPGGGAERVLAACVHDPVQIIVSVSTAAIAPASADEADILQQITARIGQGGAMTAAPVRTETVGGVSARVGDLTGTVQMPGGESARVEAMLVLVPAGTGTLMIMALSRDPVHARVAPIVRAMIPTIAGLGAAPPAWRVAATCPDGMSGAPAGGFAPNGMRRVIRCTSPDHSQFEVLESLLPLRGDDDARIPAASIQRSLGAQLQQLGGEVRVDRTQPFEPTPAVHGFVTAIHGTATDPRAPAGSPDAALHVEAAVAVIPTTSGHAEVVAISQTLDGAALATGLLAFARANVRLDGVGVTASTPTADAPPAPGNAMSTPATPAAPPSARRREVDLSRPLWDPGQEERPHGTARPSADKSCACTTPGHTPRRVTVFGTALALALVAAARRRRRAH